MSVPTLSNSETIESNVKGSLSMSKYAKLAPETVKPKKSTSFAPLTFPEMVAVG
jgi:hypothetical protein